MRLQQAQTETLNPTHHPQIHNLDLPPIAASAINLEMMLNLSLDHLERKPLL